MEQTIYNSVGYFRSLINKVEQYYLRQLMEDFVQNEIKEIGVYALVSTREREYVQPDISAFREHQKRKLAFQIAEKILPMCEVITEETPYGERVTLKALFINPTTPQVIRQQSLSLGGLCDPSGSQERGEKG